MLVGDAVPLVTEQHHRALFRGFEARKRDRSFGELDGDDLPAGLSLLGNPAVLVDGDPVDARAPSWSERVAVLERGPVVRCVRDRDARPDGIAGPQQGAKVRLERHPEWGYYEMVPAAVAAVAAATTDLAGSRFAGAQRARATALSSVMLVSLPAGVRSLPARGLRPLIHLHGVAQRRESVAHHMWAVRHEDMLDGQIRESAE